MLFRGIDEDTHEYIYEDCASVGPRTQRERRLLARRTPPRVLIQAMSDEVRALADAHARIYATPTPVTTPRLAEVAEEAEEEEEPSPAPSPRLVESPRRRTMRGDRAPAWLRLGIAWPSLAALPTPLTAEAVKDATKASPALRTICRVYGMDSGDKRKARSAFFKAHGAHGAAWLCIWARVQGFDRLAQKMRKKCVGEDVPWIHFLAAADSVAGADDYTAEVALRVLHAALDTSFARYLELRQAYPALARENIVGGAPFIGVADAPAVRMAHVQAMLAAPRVDIATACAALRSDDFDGTTRPVLAAYFATTPSDDEANTFALALHDMVVRRGGVRDGYVAAVLDCLPAAVLAPAIARIPPNACVAFARIWSALWPDGTYERIAELLNAQRDTHAALVERFPLSASPRPHPPPESPRKRNSAHTFFLHIASLKKSNTNKQQRMQRSQSVHSM